MAEIEKDEDFMEALSEAGIKLIDSKKIYTGRILNLRVDEIRLANGRRTTREVVEYRGAVTLIPVLGDNILFVRQFRYPVGEELLELPAGKIEENEHPDDTAYRELIEETGYRAGRLQLLSRFYTAPGYSTEDMYLFLADELERSEMSPDYDEIIEPIQLPVEQVFEMLRRDEFHDAKTILGLLWFFQFVREK